MHWKDGVFQGFRCPICRTESYVPVRVKRPNGNWYVTPFYQCFGCSAMFTDPVQFTRCETILKPIAFGTGEHPGITARRREPTGEESAEGRRRGESDSE